MWCVAKNSEKTYTTCHVAQGPISPVKRLRKLVKLSVSGGRRGTALSVFLNKLNNRQSGEEGLVTGLLHLTK